MKAYRNILAVLLAIVISFSFPCISFALDDTAVQEIEVRTVEERAEEILSSMTLEEKVAQMFMGAIILFEKSEKVMQALAVSPISIHAYILSKVISIGLISLLSGVLIALFSGMEHSYIHLAVGIMLGSALFTLVGISLSAFISTMNNFMLIMVPTLIISVAPISVYTMGYKSGAMLLHPSISLIELMSGNISVISLIAISIWCIAMYIFSCLSVKKMMTI